MRYTHPFGLACAALVAALPWTAQADAQTSSSNTADRFTSSVAQPDDAERRPTTTTFLGDTGIWYVPTAEVLERRTWSVGGDRRGTNYVQGFTNVADFAGTAALGVTDRVEVFGSYLFDTRINRQDTPVFADDARGGGVVARYPGVSGSWTGNTRGDLYLGTKVNMRSQYRRSPMALAVRTMVKLPTGNDVTGSSTGRTDVMADLIGSREIAHAVEVSTFVGYEVRGRPSGLETSRGSYRWGTGAAFPSRSALRFSAEANGDLPTHYRATVTDNAVVGSDGTLRPFESDIRNRTRGTGGLTYQTAAGVFIGTGLSWNAPRYWDWQVRAGYHGGNQEQRRRATPGALTSDLAGPLPSVASGEGFIARGTGVAPGEGAAGTDASSRASVLPTRDGALTTTEPSQVASADRGPVGDRRDRELTGTGAADGTTGTAFAPRDAVVATGGGVAPAIGSDGALTSLLSGSRSLESGAQGTPQASYTFDDVYFDFDRSALRSQEMAVMDAAVTAMLADRALTVAFDGHTCDIGTSVYNLALGGRRAGAVRDYFVSRGVSADRMNTATSGEQSPEHSNAEEATRHLNRRVALVMTAAR